MESHIFMQERHKLKGNRDLKVGMKKTKSIKQEVAFKYGENDEWLVKDKKRISAGKCIFPQAR